MFGSNIHEGSRLLRRSFGGSGTRGSRSPGRSSRHCRCTSLRRTCRRPCRQRQRSRWGTVLNIDVVRQGSRQGREETRQKCVWCVREERKGGAGGGKDDTDDDLDAFAPEQQLVDVPPLPILPPLTKQQESMMVKRTLLINSGKCRREQQPVEAQGRANEWPQRNGASPVSTKAAAAGVGVRWQRCSSHHCSGRLLRR